VSAGRPTSASQPLTRAALAALPAGSRPAEAVLAAGVGMAHLGLGAFHRSHQAIFTERAMLAEPGDWAIAGVGPRSCATADVLTRQDHLYSLVERGPERDEAKVHGAIHQAMCASRDPDGWRALIAAPATRIVTATVTEAGYPHDPATLVLDRTAPGVAADLDGRDPPRTALGLLVSGLTARHREGGAPLALVSCDNLAGNGNLLRTLILQWCEQVGGTDVGGWLEESVSFPSCVVDRITPATTPADRATVRELLGVDDEAATVAEPFSQWVLEDSFPAGRPAWHEAGAVLVSDVAPWERAKLRLLNAAHSLLAYLGLACGLTTVADAMGEPALAGAVEALMAEASVPLAGDGGPDLDDYARSVLERFSNRRLSYRLDQVAKGGRDKVAQRLVPTLRSLHERGVSPVWSALAVASWSLHDGDTLRAVAPDLWETAAVADAVAGWCRELERAGPLAAIGRALGT
jgi:fructuronate reductase